MNGHDFTEKDTAEDLLKSSPEKEVKQIKHIFDCFRLNRLAFETVKNNPNNGDRTIDSSFGTDIGNALPASKDRDEKLSKKDKNKAQKTVHASLWRKKTQIERLFASVSI